MPSRPPPSPDLFAYAESEPVGWKQRAALSARLPRPQQLADLSEAELAELTCLLSNELQRRIRRDTRGRLDTHLARAIEQLASVLPSASAKNSPPLPEASAILEGKRKAIKAALKAGVKPTQVARHFGVSAAEVRKVASQPD
jgi:hypothetical protein